MKKIGVLTTSGGQGGVFACNYGAALQGYALVTQLRLMGFEAYDVNYLSHNEYHPQQYSCLQRIMKRIPLLFNYGLVKNKIQIYKNRKKFQQLHQVFREFVDESKLTYQNGKMYSLDELQKITDSFFGFIVGSDVVWNPYLRKNKNDEGYFLTFVPDGIRRIAYAPSFGVTTLPPESKNNLAELLNRFDAISVREASGAKLVKKETGIDVPVVLDPTMLLEPKEYEKITVIPKDLPKHYIAVYQFGGMESTNRKIQEIQEKLNLPIVYIPSGMKNINKARYDLGPKEFIGLIKNADLVISDSFHCTVFCLLCNTPFVTFCRTMPTEKTNLNSRMADLLEMVGMSNRMIYPEQKIDFNYLLNCDFTKVNIVLAERRKQSLEYLKKALEINEY